MTRYPQLRAMTRRFFLRVRDARFVRLDICLNESQKQSIIVSRRSRAVPGPFEIRTRISFNLCKTRGGKDKTYSSRLGLMINPRERWLRSLSPPSQLLCRKVRRLASFAPRPQRRFLAFVDRATHATLGAVRTDEEALPVV